MNKILDLLLVMEPLKDLNTYFKQMEETYGSNRWGQCKTQAELNNLLVTEFIPSTTEFVTRVAFESVKAVVDLCLEDWPAALGSVFTVIKELYEYIGHTGPLREDHVTLLSRVETMELFLQQNFNYTPPTN